MPKRVSDSSWRILSLLKAFKPLFLLIMAARKKDSSMTPMQTSPDGPKKALLYDEVRNCQV